MYVKVENPPPLPGDTFTFTLFVNGSPTALVVVLVNGQISGSNLVNSIPIAAGSELEVEFSKSGSPANAGAMRADVEFA